MKNLENQKLIAAYHLSDEIYSIFRDIRLAKFVLNSAMDDLIPAEDLNTTENGKIRLSYEQMILQMEIINDYICKSFEQLSILECYCQKHLENNS